MIKMKLWHPWILLIFSYIVGLAIALSKIHMINHEKRILFQKNAMIFVLSILGIGIFVYYQGRSHNLVFPSVIYPGIILMGIFLGNLLRQIRLQKKSVLKFVNILTAFIILTILCAFSTLAVCNLIANKNIHLFLNKKELNSKKYLDDYSEYNVQNMEFITEQESLYYKKYNLKDTKKFSAYVDIFTYEECDKIEEYLKSTDKDVVIEKTLYEILKERYNWDMKDKFEIQEKKDKIILINRK